MKIIDTFLLFLIGLPLVASIFIRFALFNSDKFAMSFAITFGVFACVGIGFAFVNYRSPPQFLIESGYLFFVIPGLLIAFFVGAAVSDGDGADSFWSGVGLALFIAIVMAGVYAGLRKLGYEQLIPAGAAVVIFCLIGLAISLLGPIISGYTLSAVAYSLITGDSTIDVFLWKELFDFLNISSTFLKVIVMIVLSIASASDTISTIFDD